MPGWEVHSRAYELLKLDTYVCRLVDILVDSEPPTFGELLAGVSDPSLLGERAPRHFGFRPAEFPAMYGYVVRRYGVEGGRCLLAHFALDEVEGCLRRGYSREMVRESVELLLRGYEEECRTQRDLCQEFEGVRASLRSALLGALDSIVSEVGRWLSERVAPAEVLASSLGELLGVMLRLSLVARGYRGKVGTRADPEVFRRLYPWARSLLRVELLEAVRRGEIRDVEGVVEALNRVKVSVASAKTTIPQLLDLLEKEREKTPELGRAVELMRAVVRRVVEDYVKERGGSPGTGFSA